MRRPTNHTRPVFRPAPHGIRRSARRPWTPARLATPMARAYLILGIFDVRIFDVRIFDVQGWLGHNGSLPGYECIAVYLPQAQATMVIVLNTDVLHDGKEPSTLFGEAVTHIVPPSTCTPATNRRRPRSVERVTR